MLCTSHSKGWICLHTETKVTLLSNYELFYFYSERRGEFYGRASEHGIEHKHRTNTFCHIVCLSQEHIYGMEQKERNAFHLNFVVIQSEWMMNLDAAKV